MLSPSPLLESKGLKAWMDLQPCRGRRAGVRCRAPLSLVRDCRGAELPGEPGSRFLPSASAVSQLQSSDHKPLLTPDAAVG